MGLLLGPPSKGMAGRVSSAQDLGGRACPLFLSPCEHNVLSHVSEHTGSAQGSKVQSSPESLCLSLVPEPASPVAVTKSFPSCTPMPALTHPVPHINTEQGHQHSSTHQHRTSRQPLLLIPTWQKTHECKVLVPGAPAEVETSSGPVPSPKCDHA